MKILLIGEFSGVHNNLKKGMEAHGHEVFLANDGDAFKKFDHDITITPFKGPYLGKILNVLFFLSNYKKFSGYDIVQFTDPFAFPYYYYYLGIPLIVFSCNRKTFYYACATDPAYIKNRDKFKYFPYDGHSLDNFPDYDAKLKKHLYRIFLKKISAIIPSSYEYAFGYFGHSKLSSPILLPGSGEYVDDIKQVEQKVRILFGITRRDHKGADYILDALNRIEKKYTDRVEITVVEKLPFADYLNYLRNTDILIDQCKSYGYGMNAVFAMEKGVIVLSGAEQDALEFQNTMECPVINIIPDATQIENAITTVITMENDHLHHLKMKSLQYAKNIHDPQKIAGELINTYIGAP